jgi:signal transduction histidine kinase
MDTDARELDERVALELLEPVFRTIRRDAPFTTLVPLVVVAVMWSPIDHVLLITWAVLMEALIGARYLVALAYFRAHVSPALAYQWGRRVSVVTAVIAMLWASSVFLFHVPGSVEHQVFLYTLMVTLSNGSVVAGIRWLPLFYLYALPILGAVVVRLALGGTLSYVMLALLMLWALLAIVGYARSLHRTMRSEVLLRHESAALAGALEAKTAEARQAALAKSRFLATASHDLRQPLHALSLFIDVLREAKSDRERAVLFPRIELSLNTLRKLFDALLDVSRLDAKVVKPEISHFDVTELLESLAEEYRPAAGKKGLELKVQSRPVIVVSDRLLLERVLRNLVSNALRYTDNGGILLSTRPRGDRVLLQVWDTGLGIPGDSREKVFDEFQQLHVADRGRPRGLGLGLSLVRRLCRLLNHPLEFRSRVGSGSVFSISVPRGSSDRLSRVEETVTLHSWDLRGKHVLVIDDDHEILVAMQTLLSNWGCEVIVAESLAEAIVAVNARQITPDLLVSDLSLSDEKDGIGAIDSLRQRFGAAIPGILITGETAPEHIRMAKASGYELLQKPVRPAHLRSVIHHHLSIRTS